MTMAIACSSWEDTSAVEVTESLSRVNRKACTKNRSSSTSDSSSNRSPKPPGNCSVDYCLSIPGRAYCCRDCTCCSSENPSIGRTKGSGVFVINDCKVAGSEANHGISWTSHGILAGRTECTRDWSAASGCGGPSRNKQRLPTTLHDPDTFLFPPQKRT